MNQRIPSECGMTLLEVLVALIIIAITVGTVFESLSGSRRISFRADVAIDAVRIANNLLGNALLMKEMVEAGSGRITGPVLGEPGWSYEIAAAPLVIETSPGGNMAEIPDMVDLRLCVSNSSLSLKSYCLHRWMRRIAEPAVRTPAARSRTTRN